MYFIKLLADGDIVVAVESVEEPEYVQELNGHLIRCSEYYAQGILIKGEAYQLRDRPALSGERELAAVFIAEDEYDNLKSQIDGLPEAPDPEGETPTEPDEESVLTNAEVKALLLDLQRRIAAQEENTELTATVQELADELAAAKILLGVE